MRMLTLKLSGDKFDTSAQQNVAATEPAREPAHLDRAFEKIMRTIQIISLSYESTRQLHQYLKEPLKNVASAAKARKKRAKNRSLYGINEDFEPVFNAVFASAVVFQRLLKTQAKLASTKTSFSLPHFLSISPDI